VRELDFTVQSLTRGWREQPSRRATQGGTALLQSVRLLASASWAAVSGVRAGSLGRSVTRGGAPKAY